MYGVPGATSAGLGTVVAQADVASRKTVSINDRFCIPSQ